MTDEELARAVIKQFEKEFGDLFYGEEQVMIGCMLAAFAAIREACAKVAETHTVRNPPEEEATIKECMMWHGEQIAQAIRTPH